MSVATMPRPHSTSSSTSIARLFISWPLLRKVPCRGCATLSEVSPVISLRQCRIISVPQKRCEAKRNRTLDPRDERLWDEMVREFRALGGTVENVRLGDGPLGRGLFPIDDS